MMSLCTILMALIVLVTIFSCNPVKLSIALLMLSSLGFYITHLSTGLTWYPSLFYLLFMGGILVVFIIISAVMPNQKSKKSQNLLLPVIMLMLINPMLNSPLQSGCTNLNLLHQTKVMLQSDYNMTLLTMLVMFYFFSFIKLICVEKSSLRTELCHSEWVL